MVYTTLDNLGVCLPRSKDSKCYGTVLLVFSKRGGEHLLPPSERGKFHTKETVPVSEKLWPLEWPDDSQSPETQNPHN
jgi:hypothetical protein